MDYNNMTVKDLRAESKKRGLTLEYKGKKFTKAELIERLIATDTVEKEQEEQVMEEQKVVEEVTTVEGTEVTNEEIKPTEQESKSNLYIFAETLEQIIEKYGKRKPDFIYEKCLHVGALVAFVHYVEAKDGNIYKKLRSAKVVGVNRKKELIRVQTILGTELEMTFNDLLSIVEPSPHPFPKDIQLYLKKQRTEKGKGLIYEKLK